MSAPQTYSKKKKSLAELSKEQDRERQHKQLLSLTREHKHNLGSDEVKDSSQDDDLEFKAELDSIPIIKIRIEDYTKSSSKEIDEVVLHKNAKVEDLFAKVIKMKRLDPSSAKRIYFETRASPHDGGLSASLLPGDVAATRTEVENFIAVYGDNFFLYEIPDETNDKENEVGQEKIKEKKENGKKENGKKDNGKKENGKKENGKKEIKIKKTKPASPVKSTNVLENRKAGISGLTLSGYGTNREAEFKSLLATEIGYPGGSIDEDFNKTVNSKKKNWRTC
jgi:hypothetical protein